MKSIFIYLFFIYFELIMYIFFSGETQSQKTKEDFYGWLLEIRQSKINSCSVAGPMGQMNRRPSV